MEKIHPSRTAEGIREIADERALSVSRLYGEYTRTRMMSPGTARWLAAKNAAGPDQTGLEDCLFGLTSRADPSITRDALRELASATVGDDIQGRGRSTEPQGPFADIVDALVSGNLDTIKDAYRTVNQVLALTERLCSYSSTELHDRVEAQVLRCREYFHKTDTLDEKKQLIQETLNEMRQTRDSVPRHPEGHRGHRRPGPPGRRGTPGGRLGREHAGEQKTPGKRARPGGLVPRPGGICPGGHRRNTGGLGGT